MKRIPQPMYQTGVEKVDGKFFSKCLCGGLELHGASECTNPTHQEFIKHALDKAERECAVLRDARDKWMNEAYRLAHELEDVGHGDRAKLFQKTAKNELVEQLKNALALGYNHLDAYGLAKGDGGFLDDQRIEAQNRFFEMAKAALKAAS
jgi:hypothetical protein